MLTAAPFIPAQDLPDCIAMTMRLADPTSDMLLRRVRLLRDCVASVQVACGFEIEAAVVLPAEMQLLCRFHGPTGATRAARQIGRAFAMHVDAAPRALWDAEVEILEISDAVVPLRRAFMENAPVRMGLVGSALDWPHSSVHRRAAASSEMGVAVA